jgi:hypothetical protein
MAYEVMFATMSAFLLIYDNTSKESIKLQKLTKLEPLTLAWMLTIIQTPLDQTSPFLILSSYVHTWLASSTLETLAFFGPTLSLFGIKSPKRSQNKMSPRRLASPSKHSPKRNVKYKGESRMNHDPYV